MGSVHKLNTARAVSDKAMQAHLRELENFVAFAAHDLRSPIGQMQSLPELIRDDFVDMGDGKIELLAHLADVVESSFQVLTDVLDYAQTAQEVMPEEVFALAEVLETQRRILDQGGRLQLRYDRVRLRADKVSLGIVLRNLIDNALRYAGEDQVKVEIRLRDLRDHQVEFVVTDNGKGFDDPARAFEWKQQTKRTGGYGLRGLKRLLEARGGGIRALPPPSGRGAHIVLRFPGALMGCAEKQM